MTRLAMAFDRFIIAIFGVLLIVIGFGALMWNADLIAGMPEYITLGDSAAMLDASWWPWAVAAAGIACVLLGLRWLVAHIPAGARRGVHTTAHTDLGTVELDLQNVAEAAAHNLADNASTYSSNGRAVLDRGVRTIELEVTAQSADDVSTVIENIDETARDIAVAVDDATVAVRTIVHMSKEGQRSRTVR